MSWIELLKTLLFVFLGMSILFFFVKIVFSTLKTVVKMIAAFGSIALIALVLANLSAIYGWFMGWFGGSA